jgi:hypothetical protein
VVAAVVAVVGAGGGCIYTHSRVTLAWPLQQGQGAMEINMFDAGELVRPALFYGACSSCGIVIPRKKHAGYGQIGAEGRCGRA